MVYNQSIYTTEIMHYTIRILYIMDNCNISLNENWKLKEVGLELFPVIASHPFEA